MNLNLKSLTSENIIIRINLIMLQKMETVFHNIPHGFNLYPLLLNYHPLEMLAQD